LQAKIALPQTAGISWGWHRPPISLTLDSPACQYLLVATELLTPRLRLRDWTLDDLAPLAEVFAKPQVWHFPLRRGLSLAETEAFLLRRIEEQESRGWTIWAAEGRTLMLECRPFESVSLS
jgi:RimJ/RimL family protein N-acetyltransferase